MTEVELTYGELTPASLAEALRDLSAVRSLDLSGNNINGSDCIALAERYVAGMPHLEALDIKDNGIGPKGATRLFEVLLQSCPRLTYLDVSENAIQDEALFALAVLLKGGVLEMLSVVTNHVTPRGLPTLCDGVRASRTLKELSLAFNVLGDDGAVLLAGMLSSHPTLEVLNLSDNGIGDEGAVALAVAFVLGRHSHVSRLDLSVNHIGDVGFQALGEALTSKHGNRHLLHLDLGCNDAVTDAGRTAFANFASHAKYLQSVDLTSCNLSDEIATALIAAIGSPDSSLITVEWFNNPRMSLGVERALYEAIQAKQAAAEVGRPASRCPFWFSLTNVAVAAVGLASVVLAVTSMRRRRLS